MSDNEVVRIVIDDIEVEGVVSCRSEFDFTIRITKPFCNLSGGSHIPHFAKAHMSFEGRYGDCSIKETLHDLYELGKYLDKEMDRLREEFIAYNNAVEKLSSEMITREEFLKKRIELRKRLRSGAIDNNTYGQLLLRLRKEHEKLEYKIWEHTCTFIEDNFPMVVPIGTQTEVMDIIKGVKSLR